MLYTQGVPAICQLFPAVTCFGLWRPGCFCKKPETLLLFLAVRLSYGVFRVGRLAAAEVLIRLQSGRPCWRLGAMPT